MVYPIEHSKYFVAATIMTTVLPASLANKQQRKCEKYFTVIIVNIQYLKTISSSLLSIYLRSLFILCFSIYTNSYKTNRHTASNWSNIRSTEKEENEIKYF